MLRQIKRLGYEAGGGVMVGIPGQSYESLAQDILTFRALDLDMIGIGPYIPHAATPLGSGALRPAIAAADQAPASEEMVYKMIALTRIVCPDANIPSTTALATINKVDGRERGLKAGANVMMPNLTPVKYRRLYEIYPEKACIDESATDCNQCLRSRIHSLGRFAGEGHGGRGAMETLADVLPDPSSRLVQLQAY
jgi:biotin synthase